VLLNKIANALQPMIFRPCHWVNEMRKADNLPAFLTLSWKPLSHLVTLDAVVGAFEGILAVAIEPVDGSWSVSAVKWSPLTAGGHCLSAAINTPANPVVCFG